MTLRKPATSAWSDAANDGRGGTVLTAGAVIASNVTARIQARTTLNKQGVDAAEETVTAPPYLVAVDVDLAPVEGDEVQVTACPGDLSLVGRSLRVDDVEHGTERFERDLFCTLIDVPPT